MFSCCWVAVELAAASVERLAMAAFASAQRASAAVMNSSVATVELVESVGVVVETDWIVESSPPQPATGDGQQRGEDGHGCHFPSHCREVSGPSDG